MQKTDKDDAARERSRQTITICLDVEQAGRYIVDMLRKLARPT